MAHEAFEAKLAALPAEASTRLAALLDYIREMIDDKIDKHGIENVIYYVQSQYDKHIAPLDIPWIPNADEPAVVDAPAKWLLAQAVHGFHKLVHKD